MPQVAALPLESVDTAAVRQSPSPASTGTPAWVGGMVLAQKLSTIPPLPCSRSSSSSSKDRQWPSLAGLCRLRLEAYNTLLQRLRAFPCPQRRLQR